jgi:YspA, cpYpsA-related SLOG family
MKLIVAGSRTFIDYPKLKASLDNLLKNTDKKDVTIISGAANGADRLGEQYAEENGIALDKHPANWDRFGKSAGYIRNKEMAEVATHLALFWDGISKGSKHMLDIAKEKGLIIRVIKILPSKVETQRKPIKGILKISREKNNET